jgi:hypothetical protein
LKDERISVLAPSGISVAVTTTAGEPGHTFRRSANKRTVELGRSKMRKLMLAGTIASTALAMWVGSAAAATPATASCEGAVASLAAQYAPGTVAYLTHLLQLDAVNAGVPMGALNLAFAQTKGDCGF